MRQGGDPHANDEEWREHCLRMQHNSDGTTRSNCVLSNREIDEASSKKIVLDYMKI